ncbi:uncharacterized protein [Nicotiana sylvestris]|uniref:uncharacterized protein n=1 Tax=Nicotiana sylvestris TaxID=4096 RepID=UPI00388CDA9A
MIKLSITNGEPSVVVNKISPSDVIAQQEKSKVVASGLANKPIIIVEGARTDPVIIKPVTQLPVINTKAIPWNYEWVIVTYKGKEVKEEVNVTRGLTRLGRCFAPEELRKAKTPRDNPVLVKKLVTEKEAEEFLRKIKVQDYSIVEQIRKMLSQISLLLLLINSNEHRRALIKILNEGHVPNKISVNHLEKIANKIFEANRVTFSDDELPVKGTEHNKALYLTCKHLPLSTMNKLKIDGERIHKNNICVRGFDGGGKDSVGDIVLELKIGPVEFTMEFQMVMFECDRQEIVVHGEENLCGHSDASILFIKGYHTPVSLPENLGTFGLGFKPTATYLKRAKRLKPKAWALPKLVPRLSGSFVKLGARKRLVTTIPSSVVDIDEELIETFQRLFDDVNMVEFGEGSSEAEIQFVGPNVKLNNWKATPLPTQKESWKQPDHVKDLRNFFHRLRMYNLKLNPAKCAFGVPSRKLLGFILLKKDIAVKWTDEFQEAFDKIEEYLSNPPVLVPPEPGRPLIIYLRVLDNSFGCVLGQHDITGRKEQAIYYLSKKFTSYDVKYTPLERTLYAVTWVAQKLKYYFSSYTTYLISCLDPLKYIFQKPKPTGRLAKWQIWLIQTLYM